ncbi:S26 family signal peptidase [Streptosporangium sp. NPDC051022]|uniref:S26 family signal peptidase n=1 Tax=Streptosporangium sp. NPDC051022 TaxID=3155752 RepID=UPI00341D74D2
MAGVGSTAVIAFFAMLLRRSLLVVTVRGRSMEPTFHDGDRILVRRGGNLAHGKIVVAERHTPFWRERKGDCRAYSSMPIGGEDATTKIGDREWIIKRIAALSGDTFSRQVHHESSELSSSIVPHGMLVLLGDNPEVSIDSRQLGYFSSDRVLGTVILHRRGRTNRPRQFTLR